LKPKFWCVSVLLCGFATPLGAQSAAIAAQPDGPKPVTSTAALPASHPASHPSKTLNGSEASAFAGPEDGSVTNGAYASKYFALSYPLPAGWTGGLPGPPPSESGYYVLGSLKPSETFQGSSKGTILIAAWDLFFVPRPARNAMELLRDINVNLPHVYTAENLPSEIKVAGHSFAQLSYTAAQLHWRVVATEIRCHMVEFVFTSADTALLEELVREMSRMQLPGDAGATAGTGGGDVPVCLKSYASGANVLHKVDPVMVGPRFTTVPTRVIIGADGKVKHIHVINAFPEQAKSVQDALAQWVFKPYTQNGVPAEVETGILFKFPPDGTTLPPGPEKY
jgi:hypothetical protein